MNQNSGAKEGYGSKHDINSPKISHMMDDDGAVLVR